MERVEQRHGSPSRATAEVEARLRRLLREQPDRTLVELQRGLREAEGVHFSIQHLWRLLRRMGLPLKKVAPRPGARHAGKPAAARGVAGAEQADGSPAVGVCG